jgi:hypothetical protein
LASRLAIPGVRLLPVAGAIFERRFNAQAVVRAGAGLLGELPNFDPGWLSKAFARHAEFVPRAAALGDK